MGEVSEKCLGVVEELRIGESRDGELGPRAKPRREDRGRATLHVQ